MAVHSIDWYRTPLDPETLRKLNERSDARGYAQSLGHFALMALTAAGAITAWVLLPWAWYWKLAVVIPILFLHGTVTAFCINAVHELVHGTVFKTTKLNEIFCNIFAFIGWINHHKFWASHSEHHKFTLHPPDDLEVVLPANPKPMNFLWSGLIANPYKAMKWRLKDHLRIARGGFEGEWELHTLPEDAAKARRKVMNWSKTVLIGHAAIFVVSVALIPFVPGIWLVPILVNFNFCYGSLLFQFCNNTQHAGLVDCVPDFRLCCRTIYLSAIPRFLYWQMNYHIEHHMYAGVPCYNLGKLHEAIKHDLPFCPKGLWQAWAQITHIRQQQAIDPTYQYVQPLPGERFADGPAQVKRTQANPDADLDTAGVSDRPRLNSRGEPLRRWECSVCGFIYDEALGLPEDGIAPGTAWEDIPDDWSCPDCGVAKADFSMVEIGDGESAKPQAAEPEGALEVENAPTTPVVIVGSGLAGYGLAKEMRQLGSERPITIVTRDGGEFYSKPMLSNAFAEGLDRDGLAKQSPDEMAEKYRLDVRARTLVESIDRQRKVVVLEGGEEIEYGQLVLAVGADQVTLPFHGDGAGSIHQINDLDSFARFRADLPEGGRVAIIGGGLIGCEFANDLAATGHTVNVIDVARLPLSRLVPPQVGELIRDQLAGVGVRWHLEGSVKAVNRHEATGEMTCMLESGEEIRADVVLSAVGLKPRINLAQHIGLDCKRGIVVDDTLRTSDRDIFAVGDCAEVGSIVRPFILPLFEGVRAIAHTLCGDEREVHYPVMPVTVKTPACPMIVCPPPPDTAGQWRVEGSGADRAARYVSSTGKVHGFVLTGSQTHRKDELAAEIDAPEIRSFALRHSSGPAADSAPA